MRKYKLSFICLFFISISLNAQTLNKDSLLLLLQTKKDTALVHLYLTIGRQYENIEIDSAKYFYKKAGVLSKKINYPIGELKYISNYTSILNIEGNSDESIKLNQEAVKIALKTNNDKYIGKAYSNLGSSYQYIGKNDVAIEKYLQAEKHFDKNSWKYLSILYSNIGIIYSDFKQHNKAIFYYDKAIENAKKGKLTQNLLIANLNKSSSLSALKKFNEAEKILAESITISKKNGFQNNHATALLNMSNLLIETGKYDEIKKYNEEALPIFTKLNDVDGIMTSKRGLGIYYFYKKNYIEAKKHTLESLKIAKEYESSINQFKAYNLLSDIEVAQQNLSKADEYKINADSIETAMNLDEVESKIEEIKGKYEADKKELKIKALTQQNDIKDLKIKRRYWITIALGLALIGLCGFAYSQYKNFKTKKALLLAQQDNAIAEERLRIASDMHDDVGSGLSRIRYIVGAVLYGQTEQKQGLTKVTEISDDAVQKMKEIIWSLNESNQNLEDLIYYIRGQMSEMAENANVSFVCHLPENIPSVFFGWKRNRNTYLLVKEAINNALKHAEAKTIKLDFEISNDLQIMITDDGKGFDTSKNFTGNGLNNYKKRIKELNAKFDLKSEIGKGTSFSFHLPLSS